MLLAELSTRSPCCKRNRDVSKSVAFLEGMNRSPPSDLEGVVRFLPPLDVKSRARRPGDLFGVLICLGVLLNGPLILGRLLPVKLAVSPLLPVTGENILRWY